MKVTQRTDRGFDVTAPVSTIFKIRDALEAAWDSGDTLVEELTEKLGGYDDDSTEEVTVAIGAEAAPDTADVLEMDPDGELEEIGSTMQRLIEEHNAKAVDEAERAASE